MLMKAADPVTLPRLESAKAAGPEVFDVIILGGGPAGLAAGLYAGRSRLKTLIIEKALLGGQVSLIDFIENYPGFPEGISGLELSQRLENHCRRMGAEVVYGNNLGVDLADQIKTVRVEEKTFKTKTVIIASGTKSKKLGIKGEDEFRGRGVSYCAVCDGAFYKDKKIVVVGGGNTAIQEAIYLTRYAASVAVIHRRAVLRADKILAERARLEPKIYFIWDALAEEILGKDQVAEILIRDLKTNKKSRLQTEGVFVYIGTIPETEFLKGQIELDQAGYILAKEDVLTSAAGVFAAGDVRKKELRQIVTAAADGALAAMAAVKYLE